MFTHHPATWPGSPLSDEHAAGAIAWAFSEIPSVLVLLVLFMQWRRADTRAAVRRDRAADRDNEAELNGLQPVLGRAQSGRLTGHAGNGASREPGEWLAGHPGVRELS